MSPPFSNSDCKALQRALLAWFDQAKRDLPWRRNRDPYRIWVSEIMLQQTLVATVAGRFEQFLRRFPTISALANASEEEVLREWQGLGYYRRAKNLHQAARQIAAMFGDTPPADAEVWKELPGIGRYTLGAILSQAFDLRYPILEANSRRVLARLAAWEGDATSSAGGKHLWQLAEDLLPASRVGDFNQALMELGSLICTAGSPRCANCPVAAWCRARQENRQDQIPIRSQRAPLTRVAEVAMIFRNRGKVLLCKRGEAGRWPGMWEFPRVEVGNPDRLKADLPQLAMDLTGLVAEDWREVHRLIHGVTRFRIELIVHEAIHHTGAFHSSTYMDHAWASVEQLGQYPRSTPQRKIASCLSSPAHPGTLFS